MRNDTTTSPRSIHLKKRKDFMRTTTKTVFFPNLSVDVKISPCFAELMPVIRCLGE